MRPNPYHIYIGGNRHKCDNGPWRDWYASGHVMMWNNSDQHVFTNDKGRGKLLHGLGSVASYFCVEIHAYVLWHDDA